MMKKHNIAITTLLASFLALVTVASSSASIIVTFSQSGNDVIGSISGSMILPSSTSTNDVSRGSDLQNGSHNTLYAVFFGSPSYDTYSGGFASLWHGLNTAPNYFTGPKGFGFSNTGLFVDAASTPGSSISPTGSYVWSNKSIDDIFFLTPTNTQTVYTASNGETISFASVPEPSSSTLLIITSFLFLKHRRRNT